MAAITTTKGSNKRKIEENSHSNPHQRQAKVPTLLSQIQTKSNTKDPLAPSTVTSVPTSQIQENSQHIVYDFDDQIQASGATTQQASAVIHAISEESLDSMGSEPDGVISEAGSQIEGVLSRASSNVTVHTVMSQTPAQPLLQTQGDEQLQADTPIPPTLPDNLPNRAIIDLTQPEIVETLPATALAVHIRGEGDGPALKIFNPLTVARCITSVCGKVAEVTQLRTGGLLVRCLSQDQVRKLLAVRAFPSPKPNCPPIPVIPSIALSGNTVCGKIYAPWLRGIPLEELLEELKSQGVFQIRKLLHDRARSHVSLYVLNFVGTTIPTEVKIGYSICKVDQFVPSPMRCYKCYRFSHSSTTCRSVPVCGRCGQKGHFKENCSTPETELVCLNCKESHSALNKNCPAYLQEIEICEAAAARNITIQDARLLLMSQQTSTRPKTRGHAFSLHTNNILRAPLTQVTYNQTAQIPQSNPPMISSDREFPRLPETATTTQKAQTRETEAQEEVITSDQEYPWFTDGQRSARTGRKTRQPQAIRDTSPDPLRTLNLPEDYIPSSAFYTASQVEPQPREQPRSRPRLIPQPRLYSQPRPHSSPVPGLPFGQLLFSLVPILLRLFLATNDSSRLECIQELCVQLNAEAERLARPSNYQTTQ